MPTRARPTTLADVASAAGVSLATASKALAGRYDVRETTRARVVAAARELSFTPNVLARGLLGGPTQSVGLITDDLDARFATKIMMGVEDALGADRSSVIMCNSRGRPELEEHHVGELLRRSVDGLVVVADSYRSRPALTGPLSAPVVYTYGFCADAEATSFVCDQRAAGRLATEHVLGRGRRRIAHLGGPADDLAAQERADGTATTARAAGLELVGKDPIFGDYNERWGYEGVAGLIADGTEFDALVCGNDQIARGALDRLEREGIARTEVSVIGFDNWSVLTRDSRHPFSSVDMNLELVGRCAAEALTGPEPLVPGVHRIAGQVADRDPPPAD